MNEQREIGTLLDYAGLAPATLADPGETERDNDTRGNVAVAGAPATHTDDQPAPLVSSAQAKELHARWDTIQGGFVDEPRQAVQQADKLVAEAMTHLAETFAEERTRLESQWDRAAGVSTEDLRIALRRYRSFFTRLLSV